MAAGPLHTERTARRDYPCSWECGDPIKAGSRYIRSALPPWTEPNESDHWWTARLHGHTYYDCPSRRHFRPAPDTGQLDPERGGER